MTEKPKIILLDCTNTDYNPDTIKQTPVGGIQHATASLASNFGNNGYDVTVINKTSSDGTYQGAYWQSRQSPLPIIKNPQNTVIIANNDPNLFSLLDQTIKNGAKPILWLHNTLNFKRFKRAKRWQAYLKYRPNGVFLSNDSLQKAPIYYPFSGKLVIPHFLDNTIYETPIKDTQDILGAPPKVVFTSQPHRGLKKCISLWQHKINTVCPEAEFHIFCNKSSALDIVQQSEEDLKRSNILLQPRCSRAELFEHISTARAMFYPGSKDETFCFAAAEAHALGVPIITQGIGSLKDRVKHGENGFIYTNKTYFADALVNVLKDNALWLKLREKAIQDAKAYQVDAVLPLWETLFRRLTANK